MDNISSWMGDRLSALVVSLMALQLAPEETPLIPAFTCFISNIDYLLLKLNLVMEYSQVLIGFI